MESKQKVSYETLSPKVKKTLLVCRNKNAITFKIGGSMKAMIIVIAMLGLASCSSIPGLSDKSYADLPTHDHIKCVGSCDVKLK